MATAAESRMAEDGDRGAYNGWIAAGIVILAVLAIGAGLWFHYHP
jgi:hypothetical protein